jgi:hypothetical protein
MSELELITFDKGLVIDKRSSLMMEDGELVAAVGFDYINDGVLECRGPLTAKNTTAYGSIHSLTRYVNYVLMVDGQTIRYKWDLDGYCDQYIPPDYNFTTAGTLASSKRCRFAKYKDFICIANNHDTKVFSGGNLYDWRIENPTVAPTATASTGGGADGAYTLYYTFLIKFPNGRTVETGLSPAGTITVTANQSIIWTFSKCNYSGTGIIINRKLYRTSTTIGEIYYVATIQDNTTTTYTDTFTDAALELSTISTTDDYAPVIEAPTDITDHLQRVFYVKGSALGWSEPYLPFNFPAANQTTVSKDGEDLTSIVRWGEQVYISSKFTWYRLQGQSDATWTVRGTWAAQGCINTHTAFATKYGIIGLWYDGLYLFDGQSMRRILDDKISPDFFTSTISSLSSCFATFDGVRYRFFYPETGTTISKHLVIDFTTYPKLRIFHNDFIANAHYFDFQSNQEYWGKTNGYEYETGTTETISTSLKTGDRVAKNIFKYKAPEYLYYDIDTNGKDAIVTIYADGVALTPTIVLNTPTRARGRIEGLAKSEGIRYSLGITCADSQSLKIYAPWGLSFNYTRD